MEFLYYSLLVAAIVAPLALVYRRKKSGKTVKPALLGQIALFFVVGVAGLSLALTGHAEGAETLSQAIYSGNNIGLGFIAAALAVGLSGVGGGIAVSSAASAALGAISENDSMFGKSLIMVALAEGISLWGLIIAFQILAKIA